MRPDAESRRPNLVATGVAVAGIATAAVLVGIYEAKHKESNSSVVGPAATAQVEKPGANEGTNQAVIDLYNRTRDLNENYDTLRQTTSEADVKDMSKTITIAKVRAIWANYAFSGQPFVKNEGNTVILDNGRSFNLDKPKDFVIGTALVDQFFQEQFSSVLKGQAGFNSFLNEQNFASSRGYDDLLWLYDNLDVEMGDNPPFARTLSLDKLAMGMQFIHDSGGKLPKKAIIAYNPSTDLKQMYANVDSDTMLLQVYSFPTGDFREESLVGYLLVHNPDIATKYKAQVSTAFNKQASQITEPRLLSPLDYGYVYTDDEELPVVLDSYLYDGVSFRKKIDYAKVTGHTAEANILQTKYDVAKAAFNGAETSVDGQKHDPLSYKTGDVVEIDDYDEYQRPGIYLRETPTLVIDPNRPTVSNLEKIQIVDGPQYFLDDQNLEATRMWKVQIGEVANGRLFVGYSDRVGWISEEWLGQKIALGN